MNILDLVKSILGMDAFLGILPENPDSVLALFEYPGAVQAFFDQTAMSFNVQARCRAKTPSEAYSQAVAVQDALDRYVGQGVVIRQASPILDIGQDKKGRHEYTVNFKIDYTGG